MRAKTGAVLAVVTAGALMFFLAWKSARLTRRAHEELTAMRVAAETAVEKLHRLEARSAKAEHDRTAQLKRLERLKGVNLAQSAIPPRPRAAPTARDWMNGRVEKETRHNPAVQNADAAGQRAAWKWGYAAMFRSLRFSPEQIERYPDIEKKRYSAELDVLTASRTSGLSDRDPVVLTLMREIEAAYEAGQRQLVGVTAYDGLQEQRRTHWARGLSRALGGMATMAQMPLTAAQGNQIAQIVIDATARNSGGDLEIPCEVDWDKVDAAARAVLSAAQWELFRTVESPGVGGGGARFVTQLNRAFLQAQGAEAAVPPSGNRPNGDRAP